MNKYNYALKQLKMIENDNDDVKFYLLVNSNKKYIYAEFRCGKNIMLAEEEVEYQAISYLESEIDKIENN
jgi:hypothetical protein